MTIFQFIADLFFVIRQLLGLVEKAQDEAVLKREQKNQKAVDRGVESHDQRPIEEAIGSGNAGKPAVIRDGVQERPRKH